MQKSIMVGTSIIHRDRKWHAQWVWPNIAPADANRIALFRNTFDIERDQQCRLLITACSQYRLWIDGRLIDDGPAPSASHHTYYDIHKLDLAAGSHTIAVLVRTCDIRQTLRGALLAELLGDADQVISATGPQWRGIAGDAWQHKTYNFRMNKLSPFQEHCDGRKLPSDWNQPGFDDAHWLPVKVITGRGDRPPKAGPWTHLEPRSIPQLERYTFFPNRIIACESALALANRSEPGDSSIEVSQPGVALAPTDVVEIHNPEALLDGSDGCQVRGQGPSRADDWDGVRDPCLTLGFKRELTAFIEIELTAPAGVDLLIGSAERLIDGRFNNTIESRFTDCYTTREGRQVFRTLCWRAFRVLRLRFRNAFGPVQVHVVRAVRVRTPLGPAHDIEGPERLAAIDRLCRRTIRLCCVDGLFDTPWREAAQWLGDVAMATVPALHWVYGDTAMTGKFFTQAALNGQADGLLSNLSNCEPQQGLGNIPDYSLWWIYGLREHRWYTGEDQWYHILYPEVVRVIRWFSRHINDQGLLEDVPNWVFIDWADCEKSGASSSLNAIYAVACDAVAEMASVVGDQNTMQWAQGMASEIRANFAEVFVDTARQAVVDAVIDGTQTEKISEHGIASALFAGCLPKDVAIAMIERAWEQDAFAQTWIECQPFYSRIVLEGLWKHGRTDLAMRLIDARWGNRFLDRGHDTCLEEWTHNGSWRHGPWTSFMRTTSHAWSAGVSEFIRRRVAGIELLEPGGKRVRITPFEAAHPYSITTPLPAGKVTVKHTPGQAPVVDLPEGVVRE